jgi:hypothetical protein
MTGSYGKKQPDGPSATLIAVAAAHRTLPEADDGVPPADR